MAGLDSGDNLQKKALDQTPANLQQLPTQEAAKTEAAVRQQNDAATANVPASFGPGKVEVADAGSSSPGVDTKTLDQLLDMSNKAKAASDAAAAGKTSADSTRAASSTAGADSTTNTQSVKDSSVAATGADSTTAAHAGKDSSAASTTATADADPTATAHAGKDSSTASTAAATGADSTAPAHAGKDSSTASTAAATGADSIVAAKTSGDASVAGTAATKDATAATAKDTAAPVSEHDKAVADFTAAGGTAKQMPDGSTQYIDKNNHVIGIILPNDADIQHFKWDGNQIVGLTSRSNNLTRVSHMEGGTDQWKDDTGKTFAMNFSLTDKGTMVWHYDTGNITLCNTDGSYMICNKDGSSEEHTKDNIIVEHQADGKILSIQYPPKDNDTPDQRESRAFHYNAKGDMDGYTAANGSCWGTLDGLHWLQINKDGTPNYHKNKDGQKEQASFTGKLSLDPTTLQVSLDNVSGKDEHGNPEAWHLTAYDRFGQKIEDKNNEQFHAHIAQYCTDYIKANGGSEAKASQIDKTLADANATAKEKIAAQFLRQMVPGKSADTLGVEATVTLAAVNTWCASQDNFKNAEIALSRAFDMQQQEARQAQVAAKDDSNSQAKVAQATGEQETTKAPVVAAKDNSALTPEEAQKVKDAEQLTQDAALNAEQARDLAEQAKNLFNLETGSGRRALSRQELQKIAGDDAAANQSEANYLLAIMPADMNEINQDFITDLLAHPRLPHKKDATQSVASAEQQPKQ